MVLASAPRDDRPTSTARPRVPIHSFIHSFFERPSLQSMARVVRGVRLRVALEEEEDDDADAVSLARADLAATLRRARALESPNESESARDDDEAIRATLARAADDARARAVNDARDAYDDDREAVVATYRAETSCDRETASLACALGIHQRKIKNFTRALEEMRAMGFDDADGVASVALMRCDFDVRRAVEVCLAAPRT